MLFVAAIILLAWYLNNYFNQHLDQKAVPDSSTVNVAPNQNQDQSTSSTSATSSSDLPEVTTTRLGSQNSAYFETIGIVKSKGTISIYPLTSGSVKKVNFQEGDYVNVGDTILEITGANLSTPLAETQLQIAQTTLANAKASYADLQKTSAETLKTAGLQLQSATNQESAIATDLDVIEQNKNALADSLSILQDSLNNTQDKNSRDQYKAGQDIDSLIYTLNAAQDDRSRTQRQINDLQDQLTNLQQQLPNPADPQITALQDNIAKLQTALDAQDKGIEDLYTAIDKARYGYSTAQNGANIGVDQIQGQIAQSESQAKVLDLNLQSTKAKLGYTGDSSDALQLAQQAYNATKVQLDAALESAANGVKLAELNVELAGSQASALQVKAPISGVLTVLDQYPGLSVSPQLPVAEIIDPKSFELTVGVDISTAERISTSSPAQIELAGHLIDVPVKSISPQVDDKTRLVNITLGLPNIFFKNNQTLNVKLPLTASSKAGGVSYLPLDAVIIGTENQFVYVNDNGKAKKIDVKIGQVSGDQIEILSGLPADAEVILTGAKNLTDGQAISVVNSSN